MNVLLLILFLGSESAPLEQLITSWCQKQSMRITRWLISDVHVFNKKAHVRYLTWKVYLRRIASDSSPQMVHIREVILVDLHSGGSHSEDSHSAGVPSDDSPQTAYWRVHSLQVFRLREFTSNDSTWQFTSLGGSPESAHTWMVHFRQFVSHLRLLTSYSSY